MIFRLSQKLNAKNKAGTLRALPLHENPFADWPAHLFVADRSQYVILSNTKSLYPTVMYGKGVTNDSHFIGRALSNIREFMEDDGQEFVYRRLIAPASESVRFARSRHGLECEGRQAYRPCMVPSRMPLTGNTPMSFWRSFALF
jgi:hypothetical protein